MVLQSDFDGLAGIATTITTSIVIAKCWGAYFDARMLFEPIFSSSSDRFRTIFVLVINHAAKTYPICDPPACRHHPELPTIRFT